MVALQYFAATRKEGLLQRTKLEELQGPLQIMVVMQQYSAEHTEYFRTLPLHDISLLTKASNSLQYT